jgi:CP family cyanate transporter-like MFS transporter
MKEKFQDQLSDKGEQIQYKKAKRSWIILACTWLLGFSMYASMLCIPPLGHIIKERLLISNAQLGFLFAIPVTMLVVVAIPSGFVADKLGTRKAVGMGAIVMAVGSLMRGVFTSSWMLFSFTCLYGVGFSLIYPNLPKLVSIWFSSEEAGLATGIYATGIATGASLALAITLPIIFPITNTIQGTFYIWSIPAIGAAILWWIVAKEPPSPHNSVRSQQARGGNEPTHIVWKNKSIWLVALMLFLNDVHFYSWTGWGPTLLMMKGAPPDLASLITSVMSWTTLPIIFLMPWASYKVGLRKPFIWASTLILAFASWSAIYISVPFGWPLMVLIGITVGGTFSMILALPIELVPKESVGVASGMVLSIGYIGGLVGPWLAGYIMDVTGTLDLALVVLTGTAIVWTVIAFLMPETGSRTRPGNSYHAGRI